MPFQPPPQKKHQDEEKEEEKEEENIFTQTFPEDDNGFWVGINEGFPFDVDED